MKVLISIIFVLSFIVNNSPLFSQNQKILDSLDNLLQIANEDTNKINLLLAIGNEYEKQPIKSVVYYKQSLNVAKLINNSLYTAKCYKYLGLIYQNGFVKYDTARIYFQENLKILEETIGKKNTEYAASLRNLALLYFVMGNYFSAEPLFLESINIRKEFQGEKNIDYANTLNELALLYSTIGNYLVAEPLFINSINILKELHGKQNVAYAIGINNLSLLYRDMGNYSAAEPLIIEAIKIYNEVLGEKHRDYARIINNLASLYLAIGSYTVAEPLFIKSMEIRKEIFGENHRDYATSLNNLALLYKLMGNYSAAESFYIKSMNIYKELIGEKHYDYSFCLFNLALLYRLMNNYTKAEQLLIEASNIRKDVLGEKNTNYGTSLFNLAVICNDIGKYFVAKPLFIESLKIQSENIDQNFSFLSEKEKEFYFKTKAGFFSVFYSFSLKRKTEDSGITKIVYNNVLRNKGLLLKSSTAMRIAILNCNDTSLIARYKKWVDLKREISQLYATEVSKRKKNPEELEQEANTIEKDLVRGSQEFCDFEKVKNLDWESIKNNLKTGEAAIEFIRFKNNISSKIDNIDSTVYCALLITPESLQPEMIPLFYEKDIEYILGTNNRNNLSYIKNIYGTKQNTSEQLYKLIWQPIEKYLIGAKTVYYSPDGLLHKVSFSSIGKGADLFLCDNYSLHRLSTTGKVAIPESFTLSKDISAGIYGGIDYSTDSTKEIIWNYLPGTKNETDKIEQIFKSKKIKTNYLSGKKAGETEFKETARACNLMHIATHGFFYPEPVYTKKEEEKKQEASDGMLTSRGGTNGFGVWQFVMNKNPLMRSGLVFAGANNVWNQKYADNKEDGVLTALEVTQLDLQKTQLVVMSACETGLGDIKGSEGVYGLQRSFKMAGVKFLVMSLWQVPDKETSEFMAKFYEKLLLYKDIRKSFNETQTELRKKYDPFYWAAFVLIE